MRREFIEGGQLTEDELRHTHEADAVMFEGAVKFRLLRELLATMSDLACGDEDYRIEPYMIRDIADGLDDWFEALKIDMRNLETILVEDAVKHARANAEAVTVT